MAEFGQVSSHPDHIVQSNHYRRGGMYKVGSSGASTRYWPAARCAGNMCAECQYYTVRSGGSRFGLGFRSGHVQYGAGYGFGGRDAIWQHIAEQFRGLQFATVYYRSSMD